VPAAAPTLALAIDPTFVVVAVVVLSLIMSIVLTGMRGAGSAHEEIGGGGLLGEPSSTSSEPPPPEGEYERLQEIRQLLRARSERRQRQGLEPLDVEAELGALLAAERASAHHDPELVEEVRQVVVARNARRERRGEAPLDVDDEVSRTLAELHP